MKMTQQDKVLKYLRLYGSITPSEAYASFGCMRLAARIHDLREEGHAITSETAQGINRYGEPVTFTRYRLRAE